MRQREVAVWVCTSVRPTWNIKEFLDNTIVFQVCGTNLIDKSSDKSSSMYYNNHLIMMLSARNQDPINLAFLA